MLSVLLLDDNEDFRLVLKELLETLGHRVVDYGNGRAGLDHLNTHEEKPDVIICDIRMPDMDGLTFFGHLRGNPAFAKLFVIATSGNKEDRKIALESGVDEYLVKPFNISELRAVIDQYAERLRKPPSHQNG